MNNVTIDAIGLDGTDGMLVKFSDGTTAGYVVWELLELKPKRELAASKKSSKRTVKVAA